MKSPRDLFKQIDEFRFQQVVETKNVDLVEPYKRHDLYEYLDKNKDKQLSLQTYTEGEPVEIDDAYEPHARKHGVVVSRGETDGTVKVRFEDGEYDVPQHHVTRRDAIATEGNCSIDDKKQIEQNGSYNEADTKCDSTDTEELKEYLCLGLKATGELVEYRFKSVQDITDNLLESYSDDGVEVLFPVQMTQHMIHENAIYEAKLTAAQTAKRERIVMGLKKNAGDLQKRYGDDWENVMYAIATKQAMNESLHHPIESRVVFKHGDGLHTVLIKEEGPYFRVEQLDRHGDVVDNQVYSSMQEAEKAAQNLL